ncbi:hypothetical protein [Deinococcus petrolearius]|uniref:Colicin V production protein n=1 Tax=Deinococcus petrolearius TaxID=1751295 RepID=A0ABW1DF57_9DEIO
MITWFDALLVTLLAAMTALGARRGLAGLAWGVLGVLGILVANALGLGVVPALLVALVLSVAGALAIGRLVRNPLEEVWHLVAGAAGGLLLGAVLAGSLALGFPYELRATPKEGLVRAYPATTLSPTLYDAVGGSVIQNALRGVWTRPSLAQKFLIPDQPR